MRALESGPSSNAIVRLDYLWVKIGYREEEEEERAGRPPISKRRLVTSKNLFPSFQYIQHLNIIHCNNRTARNYYNNNNNNNNLLRVYMFLPS